MKKAEIEKYVDRFLSGEEIVFSKETMRRFKETPKEDLILLHNNLGTQIRNVFGLWRLTWKPKIIDGVDESPDHPDAISMKIIEVAWARLQDK